MNQWVRLLEIDRRVRAGEHPSAASLATEWEVSKRLLFRDRERLIEMGAPIEWSEARRGWYYRDPTWILPAMRWSEGELLAFFLAVELARSAGSAGMQEQLMSAVGKIASASGDQVSVSLSAFRGSTSFGSSPAASVDAQTCQALQSACACRQKVSMRYFTISRGEWNVRVVHPYHLHFTRGEWILIAWDEKRNEVRSFNIARISSLQTRPDHFTTNRDFDAQTFVRSMFWAEAGRDAFEVAVFFDAYQARFVREREWHPDQTRQDHADGSATLRFPASSLPEVARWLLGYGRHARALEPPELVALVKSHLIDLASHYGLDSVSNS